MNPTKSFYGLRGFYYMARIWFFMASLAMSTIAVADIGLKKSTLDRIFGEPERVVYHDPATRGQSAKANGETFDYTGIYKHKDLSIEASWAGDEVSYMKLRGPLRSLNIGSVPQILEAINPEIPWRTEVRYRYYSGNSFAYWFKRRDGASGRFSIDMEEGYGGSKYPVGQLIVSGPSMGTRGFTAINWNKAEVLKATPTPIVDLLKR